jgi:hypothetical protein
MKKALQIVLLTVAMVGVAAAGTPSSSVPEIGVGGAATAIGLFAGVLLVVRSRRK